MSSNQIVILGDSFNWDVSIDTFNLLPAGRSISSAEFCTTAGEVQAKWRLEIFPQGINEQNEGSVAINLVNLEQKSIRADVRITLKRHINLSILQPPVFCKAKKSVLFPPNHTFVCERFISSNSLLDPVQNFVKDNKITFHIFIKIK